MTMWLWSDMVPTAHASNGLSFKTIWTKRLYGCLKLGGPSNGKPPASDLMRLWMPLWPQTYNVWLATQLWATATVDATR